MIHIKFDKVKQDGPLYILRGHMILFTNKIFNLFHLIKRCRDPDVMPHLAAFHLGLNCV